MECKEIPHVYADRYESYKEFFPHDKLTQSKRYTSAIERNNGRQRHWLAAFRRRSIVVTKSLDNLHKNPITALFLTIFYPSFRKVTRVIRTCLKAAYFGAFHSISSRKAPALLR